MKGRELKNFYHRQICPNSAGEDDVPLFRALIPGYTVISSDAQETISWCGRSESLVESRCAGLSPMNPSVAEKYQAKSLT
jgi:hypothetical protein